MISEERNDWWADSNLRSWRRKVRKDRIFLCKREWRLSVFFGQQWRLSWLGLESKTTFLIWLNELFQCFEFGWKRKVEIGKLSGEDEWLRGPQIIGISFQHIILFLIIHTVKVNNLIHFIQTILQNHYTWLLSSLVHHLFNWALYLNIIHHLKKMVEIEFLNNFRINCYFILLYLILNSEF